MSGNKHNIYIDQGSLFTKRVEIRDRLNVSIDLSPFTFAGQLRESFRATDFIPFDIIADGTYLTFSLTHEVTEDLDDKKYVYDIEMFDGDNMYRILEGQAIVSPEVTR